MRYTGKTIVTGHAKGPALKTSVPVNFTAAFTKPENLIPFQKSVIRDRHHPWYKINVRGKVLVIPAAIGSTHTGLVLLDLCKDQNGPAAIIVEHPDPLLVSGVVLAEVWYEKSIPIIEYPVSQILDTLEDGQSIEVFGDEGAFAIG